MGAEKQGRVTLKDLAGQAGVSVATASRVVNNKPGGCVSGAVRERVWETARRLGYRPNLDARSLKAGAAAGPAGTVAVLMARPESARRDAFFSECLDSLSAELLSAGFRLGDVLYLESSSGGPLPEGDGYVILGKCQETLLRACQGRTGNVVGIWRNPGPLPVDEVVCSGRRAALLAMEHLLELEHRRIAYIGDCSFENRYLGYTEGLTSRQLPLIYSLVCNVPQTRAAGEQAMEALLRQGEATAALCANDEVALGALRAVGRRRGDGPPISVISIDDTAEARRAGLTTVHIPGRDMAHLAAGLLADRFRGGHREYVHIELPCRLVERESCFFAAQGG
ncbi:MAG: LacI family transcriptional regulator [Oscillospiraceae bacterium]|nr:LacI family transcriptional regulator [Oscillospiraceae bacterium]